MKLTNIRRDYLISTLNKNDLNKNPIQQLTKWLTQASEQQLSDTTAMTLATVNPKGQPSQRTVLLKDLNHKGLVFYTNLNSRKANDIQNNQQVSLHFAWLPLERQVKIEGTAHKLSFSENVAYFSSRPKSSQLAAWASRQSHPISSRQHLEKAFETIKNKFKQGKIPLPDFWGGYLIQPHSFEFWQGGHSRLHDNFRYHRTNNHWELQRLAP
jgi:pyridoxamine 5'-phosphate oxidase